MSKPIIGIVARRTVSKLERSIMHTDDDYRLAVIKAGGIPFMIMPTQKADFPYDTHEAMRDMDFDEKEDLLNILNMCDGIIMPGGFRIFEYDKIICKYALENNIPILGICLGMQIMAAIDSEPEKTIELINNGVNHKSESDFAHKFILDENSKLYSIIGKKEFMVNSKHKCNIIKTNKFDIVGYSDDGIIEAIEDKEKKFAIGVQWHPEMIYDKSEEAEKLFKYFIKACK